MNQQIKQSGKKKLNSVIVWRKSPLSVVGVMVELNNGQSAQLCSEQYTNEPCRQSGPALGTKLFCACVCTTILKPNLFLSKYEDFLSITNAIWNLMTIHFHIIVRTFF